MNDISNIEAFKLANFKTQRAGVIPYFIDLNGNISFLLARHSTSKELGDFGGGVRKNESALSAAFREFDEETLGIFSNLYSNAASLEKCMAFTDRNLMSIIFAPVFDFRDVCSKFDNALAAAKIAQPRKKSISEISEVLWVSKFTFCELVQNYQTVGHEKIWKKVRGFLRRIKIDNFLENRFSNDFFSIGSDLVQRSAPSPVPRRIFSKEIFEIYA